MHDDVEPLWKTLSTYIKTPTKELLDTYIIRKNHTFNLEVKQSCMPILEEIEQI